MKKLKRTLNELIVCTKNPKYLGKNAACTRIKITLTIDKSKNKFQVFEMKEVVSMKKSFTLLKSDNIFFMFHRCSFN